MKHVDPERLSREQLIDYVFNLESRLEEAGAVLKAQPLANLRSAFDLSNQEAKLLAALSDGRNHSKESILSALYYERPDEAPEIKIVDVFVCKLRKKLVGYPIVIETLWGSGYRVADTSVLKSAMEGAAVLYDPAAKRAPPFTKPMGAKAPKPFADSYTATALAHLVAIAEEGVAAISSRELADAAGGKTPGAVFLTNLESRGYLEILKKAKRAERGGVWYVRLLPKAYGGLA